MYTEACNWTSIDDEIMRIILGIGIIFSALLSVIISGAVIIALSKNHFRLIRDCNSHVMLLNLSLGSLCRCLFLPWFSGTSLIVGKWIFGESNCQLHGFLTQFLSVYQMESLTHMCIERYVATKYSRNGWTVKRSQYVLFIVLCFTFSTLYSVPQLLGYGRYSLSFTCTACAFDGILPEDSLCRMVVFGILLLQSVKPVCVMVCMLHWTSNFENECFNKKDHSYERLLTHSASRITWVTLLFWTPGFLLTTWVVGNHILFNELFMEPPLIIISIPTLASELAPAMTSLSIISTNEILRHAAIKTFYDLGSYEKAK